MHPIYLSHTGHEDDSYYLNAITDRLEDWIVGQSAPEGPVGPGEAEVLLVLVGENTWRDERVQAVLAKALELRDEHPRCAVMGLLLPSYDYPGLSRRAPHGLENLHATTPRDDRYWACNIPRALMANIDSGFAMMRPFTKKLETLQGWVAEAATARTKGVVVAAGPLERFDERAIGWPVSGPEGVVDGSVLVRR